MNAVTTKFEVLTKLCASFSANSFIRTLNMEIAKITILDKV